MSSEGRTNAKKFLTQWRGLFGELDALAAAFDELDARERAVEGGEQQQEALTASVGRLQAEEGALQQSVRTVKADLGTVKARLVDAERPKLARLEELDAAIVAKQEQLDKLTADLARLRERHGIS